MGRGGGEWKEVREEVGEEASREREQGRVRREGTEWDRTGTGKGSGKVRESRNSVARLTTFFCQAGQSCVASLDRVFCYGQTQVILQKTPLSSKMKFG